MGVKVLNIGSLNYDYVYSVDHILLGGETLASINMETFCGGKGINQSIALSKSGIIVYHAGMVGEDGQILLDTCKSNGIDTKYIEQIQGKSGHTIIQVDKEGQNCILLYGGSNQRLTKKYIDNVLNDFEEGDLLLLQNEVNMLKYIIDQAYSKKMITILNPSPFDETLKQIDMNKISIFLMNEIEGTLMTGESDPERVLSVMKNKYPRSKVVLTLGKDGAIYQDKEKLYQQKIYPVKVVDTTAAGDTFTGYFIAGLLKNMKIEDILDMSACASSIAVSRKGAVNSIPTIQEVEKKRKEFLV
jgi:ribokinase